MLESVANPAKLIATGRSQYVQHSIKRLEIDNGWTFQQLSLSDYFKALGLVTGEVPNQGCKGYYTALRCREETALIMPDGNSLISRLLELADRVVIEDMDVTPRLLSQHIEEFGLMGLQVTDMADHRQPHRASVSLIEKH